MTYVAKEMEDADITCNNKLHPVCETAFPGQEAEWCHPCRLRISIARTTYFKGLKEKIEKLRETLTRHAQLARTLSRTENLYTEEHLERRLAEADITLEATKL
jgi:hypothetical protein